MTHCYTHKCNLITCINEYKIFFIYKSLFEHTKLTISDETYQPLNNRLQAIKEFRPPQSIPECLSRISSFQLYASFLPFLKRLAIPLYQMMQSKVFTWNKEQSQAWGNLRFLMSLHIKNSIFNPQLPIMLFSDSSILETAAVISQWNPKLLDFQILTCKSILFSQSLRNAAPVHRESEGIATLLDLSKIYLFQSKASTNYLFSDISSVSYISRNTTHPAR